MCQPFRTPSLPSVRTIKREQPRAKQGQEPIHKSALRDAPSKIAPVNGRDVLKNLTDIGWRTGGPGWGMSKIGGRGKSGQPARRHSPAIPRGSSHVNWPIERFGRRADLCEANGAGRASRGRESDPLGHEHSTDKPGQKSIPEISSPPQLKRVFCLLLCLFPSHPLLFQKSTRGVCPRECVNCPIVASHS